MKKASHIYRFWSEDYVQMKLPAAIMWDMDGTLVDSEPLWQQATLELSESLGRKLPQELLDATTGGLSLIHI